MTKYEDEFYSPTFVNSISPISHQNIIIYLLFYYLVRKREGERKEGRRMEREGERKEGREEEREGGIIHFLVSPHARSLRLFLYLSTLKLYVTKFSIHFKFSLISHNLYINTSLHLHLFISIYYYMLFLKLFITNF